MPIIIKIGHCFMELCGLVV